MSRRRRGFGPHHIKKWQGLALGAAIALPVVMLPSVAYAAAPANDSIANATAVQGIPYTNTVDTSEATVGVEDQNGCGAAATVWYSFAPSADGRYIFSTEGSDYDTVLNLYSGSPGNLSLIACNDDFNTVQAVLADSLTAGTTYYISAGTCCGVGEVGQIGPGGNLVFNVAAAPPLAVEVVLGPKATRQSDYTTAVVGGTVTCSEGADFYLLGTLRQKQGLNVARGDFSSAGTCTGEPTQWTAIADTGTRVWITKPATVTATYAQACDPLGCVIITFDATTKIVQAKK